MMKAVGVLSEVLRERESQEKRWGEQDHLPEEWLAILGEEFGEVARAICEFRLQGRRMAGPEIRAELIQLAAVAVAMVECSDRKGWSLLSSKEAFASVDKRKKK